MSNGLKRVVYFAKIKVVSPNGKNVVWEKFKELKEKPHRETTVKPYSQHSTLCRIIVKDISPNYIKGVIGRIRGVYLPPKYNKIKGTISDLTLSEDEGLIEMSHFVIKKVANDYVMAYEHNPDGYSLTIVRTYFNSIFPDLKKVEINYLMQDVTENKLDQIERIVEFHIRLSLSHLDTLKEHLEDLDFVLYSNIISDKFSARDIEIRFKVHREESLEGGAIKRLFRKLTRLKRQGKLPQIKKDAFKISGYDSSGNKEKISLVEDLLQKKVITSRSSNNSKHADSIDIFNKLEKSLDDYKQKIEDELKRVEQ